MMEEKDREKLNQMLDLFLDEDLVQLTVSGPFQKEEPLSKVRLRPVLIHGSLAFQAEEFSGKQAFHKNMDKNQARAYVAGLLDGKLRQAEAVSPKGRAHALAGKRGTVTVKIKKTPAAMIKPVSASLDHNRRKRYILEEGTPVPFLQDLGVMTQDGKVVRARYDKFRQINRFLEFIEDVLPKLDRDRENTIVDFGCGKSYLTFAMYYYLKELKGYPVKMVGLDLKQDVIEHCSRLSEKYGCDGLKFYHGDIETYGGLDQVDMVVTLHACDTATDYAIAKAVKWGAKVILSVPCCQHELNGQIENSLLEPVLRYGLFRERMAALYTDALRAEILENQGYRTQILEFIDMEHTPKNILIRAVKQGEKKDNAASIQAVMDFLHVKPTLADLLLKNPPQ